MNTKLDKQEPMLNLRPYQAKLIENVYQSWENHRRVLAQLPTGGGKTVIFADIATRFLKEGKRVLCIAHREELVLQGQQKLEQVSGMPVGIIKAGYPYNPLYPCQFASIQTLMRRNIDWNSDLLIIDEAHHSSASSYKKLIESCPGKVLGVTATPIRSDGYGFNHLYDELVLGPSVAELIANGYLAKFKLYAGRIKLGKLGITSSAGKDFTQKELDAIAKKLEPIDIYKEYAKFCEGKKTLIFASNVQHSLDIVDLYKSRGIRAEHLDGATPQEERKAILDRFRAGQCSVLSNCAIATEGFDLPDIEAVQIARPTKSVSLWLQMIGRALRTSPEKSDATIVDHTGTCKELGLPDAPREWSLNPVPCTPGTFTRECKHCSHVFSPPIRLIVERQVFYKGEIRVQCATDCPNCLKPVEWLQGQSTKDSESESSDEPLVNESPLNVEIEFIQIDPAFNHEILAKFSEIYKSGVRLKKDARKRARYLEKLASLIVSDKRITLKELEFGMKCLDLRCSPERILNLSFSRWFSVKLRWHEIEDVMRDRPQCIKEAVWKTLPQDVRSQIWKLKRAG